MSDPIRKPDVPDNDFAGHIGRQAGRRLKAQNNREAGVWFGLGMMGLIGWSIAVPTLAGAALGLWIDSQNSGSRSWTLALLVAGLVLGCWNAWRWVDGQDRAMREDSNDDHA